MLHLQGIRIKFEYEMEKRIVQMQRPLKFEQLLSTIKKFYGRPLSMLFVTGSNDEVGQFN